MKNKFRKFSLFIPFCISLLVYLFTLAPSVIQIDSGELAAVQYTGGIAHPTGYPLFTMLGYLFLHLPLPFTKIYSANLLAAFFCSAAVLLFTFSLKIVINNISLDNLHSTKSVKEKNPDRILLDNNRRKFIIIAGSLFLAFSRTFWFQSTSVEVYSLHLLLINAVIFILLKILYSDKQKRFFISLWFVFSFILALSFTNHLTTILIIPTVAFVYFSKEGFSKKSFIFLLKMLLFFFVVLVLVYSYLPLRAAANPTLNWGNPETFENFWRHFRGAQYSSWIFSSFESAKKQFIYFISNFHNEFTYPGILLIITGIIFVFRFQCRLFYFISLSALSTIAYSINYDIVDIDSYFLLAYIAFSFFAAIGLIQLVVILGNKFHPAVISIIIFAPVLYLGWTNFEANNQSDNFIFEDYTKGILNSVEKESIIFSYQWDYFISASYYFQNVEKYRDDVKIIDKELLRRSWYYNQIETNYPETCKNQTDNIHKFLNALKPFEHGGNFNPQLLENYYQVIMTGLVADNFPKRNFYIGTELYQNEMRNNRFKLPNGCQIVPHLFLFKIVNISDYVPAPNPDFIFRRPALENKYTEFISNNVYNMLTMRALYELSFDKKDEARKYVNKIRELFPEKTIHRQLREL